jgi:ABC-type nitrate/sulfonate/bicarbonate transport system ATPase subunit
MSIVIRNLCKRFGDTPVLQDFTWTVDGPAVLMGRSGCGKTTLLRILMGLEAPDSGTATGVERPAAVFQEDRLCPQLTAAANLVLTGHGLTQQEAERELRTLGFTDAELALPAARLSGGQKRRAALLRALLCRDAQTLLLDEPFTALDVRGVARLADLVGEHVRSGGIVMLVTHQEVPVDGVEYLVIEPERWSPRRRTAVEAALDNESALEADNAR